MIKGKVKTIHDNGYGFISSDEITKDTFCPPNLINKKKLKEGDFVEFDTIDTHKGPRVKKINKIDNPLEKKIKKLNPLLEMALKIDELTAEEYDQFCDLTQDYVHEPHFKKNVTTSKIRNIFSAIQNAKTKKDLKMLRPKLAYLAGRDKKTKSFMNDMDKLIKKIENDEQVNNFKQFFEAIVCYKREIEK